MVVEIPETGLDDNSTTNKTGGLGARPTVFSRGVQKLVFAKKRNNKLLHSKLLGGDPPPKAGDLAKLNKLRPFAKYYNLW
ncbi:MAG: hypothetical protein WBD28_08595, partial [Candidatus Zixiibacteriota bacterium]